MAVVTGKRGENELEVMTRAKELAAYTLNICKQEKHFPKRDRWILTQPIVREALDACTCIRRANAVNVCTREEYLYRHLQQAGSTKHITQNDLKGVLEYGNCKISGTAHR